MRKAIALACCVSFGLLTSAGNALAQSDEADLDEESGAERTADDEGLERLRRMPIDLKTASEDDLLQIPGMRRREASAILRAVRDGSVVEVRAIDLIPGVRRGTADRIAPYVVLSARESFAKLRARVRSSASWSDKDGAVKMFRRQHDLRIDGSKDAQGGESLRLEFRRTDSEPSAWFSYARLPAPIPGWSLTFGDLDVRTGSVLLDAGRRASLHRPSDWERRLSPDARILPGYDLGTAARGAAFQAASYERVVQASFATDKSGRRSGMLTWTEQWPFRVTTQVVRDLKTSGTALRVETDSRGVQVSIEACYEDRAASVVASCRWGERGSFLVHGIARNLHRIAAPGVPRTGNRTTDEVGAGIAVQQSPSKRFRWHIVGDLGRVEEIDRNRIAAWPSVSVGIGSVVRWEDRSSVGVEWTGLDRDRERVRRWSLRLEQRLSERINGSLAIAHRTENESRLGASAGLLTVATVSWTRTDLSMHLRWTAGDGDPAVEFWSLGPGPTVVSGLQRFAGRTREFRGVVQWDPTKTLEFAFAVAWKRRPAQELRTSILLEIHL